MTDIEIVADILRDPFSLHWSAHGIGMLRTYIDDAKTTRLNLWHDILINPGISAMHTHPWPFRSRIVTGRLENTRWLRVNERDHDAQGWTEGRIVCGHTINREAGEAYPMSPETRTVYLAPMRPEVYTPGCRYQQDPEEIHTTKAADGTATIIVRGPARDGQEASVFWPLGEEWGDASRHAVEDEMAIVFEAARALL